MNVNVMDVCMCGTDVDFLGISICGDVLLCR